MLTCLKNHNSERMYVNARGKRICRDCVNEQRHRYLATEKGQAARKRHEQTDGRRAAMTKFRQRRQSEARALIHGLKDVPCVDCGERYPHYVMDFDHVRGTKAFNVGRAYTRSLIQIRDEIEKCDVVCSNCHRERTHG